MAETMTDSAISAGSTVSNPNTGNVSIAAQEPAQGNMNTAKDMADARLAQNHGYVFYRQNSPDLMPIPQKKKGK